MYMYVFPINIQLFSSSDRNPWVETEHLVKRPPVRSLKLMFKWYLGMSNLQLNWKLVHWTLNKQKTGVFWKLSNKYIIAYVYINV